MLSFYYHFLERPCYSNTHIFTQLRGYANKQVKLKRYTASLNLPKTSFRASMKDGEARRREKEIQKVCGFSQLYKWQREQKREEFVLHDGPPYANGQPHVGHALNKILKDVTNRFMLLQGYKVHFRPGWDCHGMPIEQKALSNLKSDHKSLDPITLRKTAENFAKQAIKVQMKPFKQWGIMADWKDTIYTTYDNEYVANEIEVFHELYERGLIYQDYMPVFWSPSSGSALAEAELEYDDDHKSTALYVKFLFKHLSSSLLEKIGLKLEDENIFLSIWTTTPWTLPLNKAVCYAENIEYVFLQDRKSGDVLVMSLDSVGNFTLLTHSEFEVLGSFRGSDLHGSTYVHPLNNEISPLLPGHHIKLGKGTGLVHTAPAHGPEDFQVAIKHGLPMECHVDEDGLYTSEVGQLLHGKDVLGEGNKLVMTLVEENILHQEEFTHSYPYDWRTKEPVILRASKQWFVNTKNIKDQAMECLNNVQITPRTSARGMISQLDVRTYWCISRQRVWGVPIPIFYEKYSGKPLISQSSIRHLQDLFKKHGADCWWNMPLSDLLPEAVVTESGFNPSSEFIKSNDVLDIWFDSGTSWATVLKDKGGESDVYLEGLDQFGGWFQSSLLTSIATQNKAPYKSLVVHGFVVDDNGKKMSKSVGNVVDPIVVVNGGKDREAEPSYGADVLRWWSAQAGLDTKVTIGSDTLNNCNEQVFKIRKSVRYLLSNLYDFDCKFEVPYGRLPLQDKYMLHLLGQFSNQVTEAYSSYNYSRVATLIERFVNTSISAYYCHITKDRMYCEPSNSVSRRSCQTVQYHMLLCLTKVIAPVLLHMAEEVFRHHPFNGDPDSVFKSNWFNPGDEWDQDHVATVMDVVLNIRDTFNSAITTCNPVDFDVLIAAKWNLFQDIKKLQPENMTSTNSGLTEILGCSTCSVVAKPPLVIPEEATVIEGKLLHKKKDGFEKERKYLLVILPAENYICERCRRYTSDKYGKPCDRCTDVLAAEWE